MVGFNIFRKIKKVIYIVVQEKKTIKRFSIGVYFYNFVLYYLILSLFSLNFDGSLFIELSYIYGLYPQKKFLDTSPELSKTTNGFIIWTLILD